MKSGIALLFILLVPILLLAATASASPAFQDGFVTGYLTVSGEGQTEIVSSNQDRWKGFTNTEVLFGKGSKNISPPAASTSRAISLKSTGTWTFAARDVREMFCITDPYDNSTIRRIP